MIFKARRLLAIIVSAMLAFAGLTAIQLSTQQRAEAADVSRFDPGLIISDSVFFDFGTMNVADIQRFLESKVPVCKDGDGGPKCLRNYTMDTPAKAADDGRCDAMEAKTDQTAAQIIYDVARACKINPRVLLVTLQKEQGLVQATNPTARMYAAALGFACPDVDPNNSCGRVKAGLFNQLYFGAGQFQWYGDPRGSFTYLKVGKTSNVRYHPNSSCGTKPVMIKSQATANLYYYTPYTPNDAALKNLYGSGDSCSAYGNRNFWRFYTDWFGDPVAGGFLLKSASSPTYLIVDNNRYLVDDPALLKALAPLGPLGVISNDYLNTFTEAGTMTRVVKSAVGKYYFVDGGKKFLFNDCNQVSSFGLDCTKAVQLTSSQLAALADSGPMSAYVMGSGSTNDTYVISGGFKRELLDAPSATANGINLPVLNTKLNISAFSYLPWGPPIIKNGSIFTNRDTKNPVVYIDGLAYEIPAAVSKDLDLAPWFESSTGTLSTAGLSVAASTTPILNFNRDDQGRTWLLTSAGKRLVTDGKELLADSPLLPNSFFARIATMDAPITAPLFARTAVDKKLYFVRGGVRKEIKATADRAKLIPQLAMPNVQVLSPSALNQIVEAGAALPPGTLVEGPITAKAKPAMYWVNGNDRLIQVPDDGQALALGLGVNGKVTPRQVTATDLRGMVRNGNFTGLKLNCDGQIYLMTAGKAYPIASDIAEVYPGAAIAVDALNCAQLAKQTQEIGRFIRTPDRAYWLITNGKKQAIANVTAYRALVGQTPMSTLPAVIVDQRFADLIPTGHKAGVTVTDPGPKPTASPTPSVSPTPTASATPKPTTTPKPTVSPTPTATPKPIATATPTPTPTAIRKYTVVSGDTLNKIAAKFAVTVTAIKQANNLTSDTIKLGQVLVIP